MRSVHVLPDGGRNGNNLQDFAPLDNLLYPRSKGDFGRARQQPQFVYQGSCFVCPLLPHFQICGRLHDNPLMATAHTRFALCVLRADCCIKSDDTDGFRLAVRFRACRLRSTTTISMAAEISTSPRDIEPKTKDSHLPCHTESGADGPMSETTTAFFRRCGTLTDAAGETLATGGQVMFFGLDGDTQLRWDGGKNLFEFFPEGEYNFGRRAPGKTQPEYVSLETAHALTIANGILSIKVQWCGILDIFAMYDLLNANPQSTVWYEIFTTTTELHSNDSMARRMSVMRDHARDAAWKTTTVRLERPRQA